MGDISQALLQGTAPATPEAEPGQPAPAPQGLSKMLLGGDQASARLTQSVKEAVPKSPTDSRQVINLADRTGLTLDVIDRNRDAIAKTAAQTDFDADQFQTAVPKLSEYMAQHPVQAAAVKDDVGPLSTIERVLSGIETALAPESVLANPDIMRSSLVRSGASGVLSGLGSFIHGAPQLLTAMGGGTPAQQLTTTGDPKMDAWMRMTDPLQPLSDIGGALKSLGEKIDVPKEQQTFGTELAKTVGGFVPFLAAEFGTEGAATPMFAASGADYMGDRADQAGASPEQRNRAVLLGAASNALIAKAGFMDILDRLPPQIKNRALSWIADKGLSFLDQAAIQGGMQVANNAIVKTQLDPNQQLMDGVVASGGTGATSGVLLRTMMQVLAGRHAAVTQTSQDALDAIANASKDSKLRQESPSQFEALVKSMKQQGTDNVYVPIDRWTTFFQGQNVDPATVAADVTGSNDAYAEAHATGGDIAIPVEKFASKIAPTDYYDGLRGDIRLHPDEMTSNEIKEFQARHDELIEQMEQSAKETQDWKPDNTDEEKAYNAIHDDITGQLRDKFSPDVSDRYAQIFAKSFVTQALRAGKDPLTDWQQYQVNVEHEVPEPLRARDMVDTDLDPMLDAMRGGKMPTERQVYGPSLVEFLRERGGMQDEDGELKAMDAHKVSPGSKTPLVSKTGMPMDKAAELAHEAGYLPERDIGTLLTALDNELRGRRQFSPMNTDTGLENTRSAMLEVENYLAMRGHDIRNLTNGEAKRVINGQEPGDTFNQGKIPQVYFKGDVPDDARGAVKFALEQHGFDRDEALIALDGMRSSLGNDLVKRAIDALRQASIDKLGRDYFQKRRGSINFQPPDPDGVRRVTIRLSPNADLSTFVHETGHFWLDRLSTLAGEKDAPQQIKDDYARTLKFLGAEEGKELTEEQHETFARATEAYMMEGKAPDMELQDTFSRVRAWMVGVYRNMTKLGVKLTDEVRGVFDRLIATDKEIEAARTAQEHIPIFDSAAEAGMTEKEFQKYKDTVAAAEHEAQQDLSDKVLRPYNREVMKQYRAQREAIRDTVEKEINSQPVYKAIHFLQKGEELPGNAKPWFNPFKLDRAEIEKMYGEDFAKRLPRGTMAAKDGYSLSDAADIFGFSSGDELVKAMVNATPRVKTIEALTDERLRDAHGDPLKDGTIHSDAQAAVHNEKRAEVLQRELAALNNRSTRPRKITTLQVLKRMAHDLLSSKKVSNVQPNLYRLAEAKAGRLAYVAAREGRLDEAASYKQQQLINHELYRAAVAAKDEIRKAVDTMQSFTTRKVREMIGKAGGEYLAQIDALNDRYSFARISGAEATRRTSLAKWAADQEKNGQDVQIPDDVLNEARKVSYRDITLDELRGVRDAAINIATMAKNINKLFANVRAQQLNEAAATVRSTIEESHEIKAIKPDFAPSLAKKLKTKASGFIAAHTKLEFLFDFLDGNRPIGRVWETMFKPFAEAENAENIRMRESARQLGEIFDRYSRTERAMWYHDKTYVPEVEQSFNKSSLLSLALNMGNEYNRDAVMKGYGWTEAQVRAVLDHLDKRDWDTVQAIWDHLDNYYPDVAALQKRITGLEPEKVQANPVDTKHGTYRGGYYPLKFDSVLSNKQMIQDEHADAQNLFGQHWARVMTQKGHTIERTNSGGKPPLLNLSVLSEHIMNVIHDLTHREALIDAVKLVNHPEIREAIQGSAGTEMYRQLTPWLRNIASDRLPYHGPLEDMLSKARLGATMVNMGFKVSTGVYQLSGVAQSVSRIGPVYMAKGIARMAAGVPIEKQKAELEFVFDRSEAMKHRMQTYDRDARAVLNKLSLGGQISDIQHMALYHIGFADMMVSVPTWLGAYEKAMDGNAEGIGKGDENRAIDYADSMVRMTQPAAGAKDLPQIMTGPSYHKIFTMFYSYWSTTMNMMQREFRTQQRLGVKNLPHFAAAMTSLWITQALLGDLMVGRGPEKDESWTKWAIEHVSEFPLDGIIGLRDIAHATVNYAERGKLDFEFTPVADAFASIAQAAVAGAHVVQGKATKEDTKNALMAAGYWGSLPARQMWITGSYLHDWITGKTQPTGFLDALRGLAYGEKH